MYQLLKHLHSINRWLVIVFLLVSIVLLIKNKSLNKKIKTVSITAMLAHLQLLIGIVLYIISPMVIFSAESMSNHLTRFYLVEHTTLMLISIILLTLGSKVYKKLNYNLTAHRKALVYYIIALVLILVAIPWPFMNLGGNWI